MALLSYMIMTSFGLGLLSVMFRKIFGLLLLGCFGFLIFNPSWLALSLLKINLSMADIRFNGLDAVPASITTNIVSVIAAFFTGQFFAWIYKVFIYKVPVETMAQKKKRVMKEFQGYDLENI